jgi:hypothetical protein
MTTMQSGTTQLPVHPLSALSLVLADWLALGLNIVTAMDAYWPISIAAAVLASLAIYCSERMLGQVSQRLALIIAASAGPLIVLPFPLAGSVVGVTLLAWAAIGWLVHRKRLAAQG